MGKFAIRNLYDKSVGLARQSPHGRQNLPTTEARELRNDTSSDKAPRAIKSKAFFTFRKKTRIEVTEPTGQQVTVNAIANDSNAGVKTPNATKTPTLASPFLRRSTPSWASTQGRVRSEVFVPLDFYSPSFMDSLSSTTSSAEVQDVGGVLDKPPSSFGRPYYDTATFSVFQPLSKDDEDAAQLRRSVNGNQHATVPTSLISASTASETHISVMLLPAPPIIISSPTPPNFGRLEGAELHVVQDIEVLDLELEHHSATDGFCKTLETVQKAARQLEHDTTFSESNVYRFTAPIVVFLYILIMATILPRRRAEIILKLGVDEGYTVLCFLLLTVLGVPFVLMALRATLWMMGRLFQLFCTLDVQEAFGKGVCVDSNGARASDADLIVGNLLGTRKS